MDHHLKSWELRLLSFECRQTIVFHKTARWFSKKWLLFFSHLRRLKTSHSEKSARNTSVSSTREFWDLRLKTKSWNFADVRTHLREVFQKILYSIWTENLVFSVFSCQKIACLSSIRGDFERKTWKCSGNLLHFPFISRILLLSKDFIYNIGYKGRREICIK